MAKHKKLIEVVDKNSEGQDINPIAYASEPMIEGHILDEEEIRIERLKQEETELTELLLKGMPSKTELRTVPTACAAKLANWESSQATNVAKWRKVRLALYGDEKMLRIDSIRPE